MPEKENIPLLSEGDFLRLDAINNNEKQQFEIAKEIDQINENIQGKTHNLNIIQNIDELPPQQQSVHHLKEIQKQLENLIDNCKEKELIDMQKFLFEFIAKVENIKKEIDKCKKEKPENYEEKIIQIWKNSIQELQSNITDKKKKVYDILNHFFKLDFSLADAQILQENKSFQTGAKISENGINEMSEKVKYLIKNIEFTKLFVLMGMLEEFFEHYFNNSHIYLNTHKEIIEKFNTNFLKLKKWLLNSQYKIVISNDTYSQPSTKLQLPALNNQLQNTNQNEYLTVIFNEILQILKTNNIYLSTFIAILDKNIEENNQNAIKILENTKISEISQGKRHEAYMKFINAIAYLMNVNLQDIQITVETFIDQTDLPLRTKGITLFNQHDITIENPENYLSLHHIFQEFFETGVFDNEKIVNNLQNSALYTITADVFNAYARYEHALQERQRYNMHSHLTPEERHQQHKDLKRKLETAKIEEEEAQKIRDKAFEKVVKNPHIKISDMPITENAMLEMIRILCTRHRKSQEKVLEIRNQINQFKHEKHNPNLPDTLYAIELIIKLFEILKDCINPEVTIELKRESISKSEENEKILKELRKKEKETQPETDRSILPDPKDQIIAEQQEKIDKLEDEVENLKKMFQQMQEQISKISKENQ